MPSPVALHTKTYVPEGTSLHPAKKSPLVILHGLFGTGDNWAYLCRALAAKGLTVIAVDLRNHGQSPWTDTHTYDDMATDVIALLEGLKQTDARQRPCSATAWEARWRCLLRLSDLTLKT